MADKVIARYGDWAYIDCYDRGLIEIESVSFEEDAYGSRSCELYSGWQFNEIHYQCERKRECSLNTGNLGNPCELSGDAWDRWQLIVEFTCSGESIRSHHHKYKSDFSFAHLGPMDQMSLYLASNFTKC